MTVPAQPTPLDRTMEALRALILSVFPALKYWVVHEYAVIECDGLTFSGQPTDADFSPALPTAVPYAPALAGAYSVVPIGTLAYVGFANADPSKPYLVRFTANATSTTTTIDAGTVNVGPGASAVNIGDGFAAIVREGDSYTATGIVPGTITLTLLTTLDPNGPTKGKA